MVDIIGVLGHIEPQLYENVNEHFNNRDWCKR